MITWALAIKGAKAVGGFLRGVPWWVWLAVALAGLWWWDRGEQYDAGVAAENTRWVEAQAEADREARVAEAKRDSDGKTIDTKSDERAAAAVADTRTETAKAVERVKYETRTIVVPADCPVGLPPVVREEGRAAVERARRAGDPLRKGRDP